MSQYKQGSRYTICQQLSLIGRFSQFFTIRSPLFIYFVEDCNISAHNFSPKSCFIFAKSIHSIFRRLVITYSFLLLFTLHNAATNLTLKIASRWAAATNPTLKIASRRATARNPTLKIASRWAAATNLALKIAFLRTAATNCSQTIATFYLRHGKVQKQLLSFAQRQQIVRKQLPLSLCGMEKFRNNCFPPHNGNKLFANNCHFLSATTNLAFKIASR